MRSLLSRWSNGFLRLLAAVAFVVVGVSMPCPVQAQWDEQLSWRNFDLGDPSQVPPVGDYTTPTRDQGTCPSCALYASVGAMEMLFKHQENNPVLSLELSVEHLMQADNGYPICGIQCFQQPYTGTDDLPCVLDHLMSSGTLSNRTLGTFYATGWHQVWIGIASM